MCFPLKGAYNSLKYTSKKIHFVKKMLWLWDEIEKYIDALKMYSIFLSWSWMMYLSNSMNEIFAKLKFKKFLFSIMFFTKSKIYHQKILLMQVQKMLTDEH